MTDTTSLRVAALLMRGAEDAYLPPPEPLLCDSCGGPTDSRDGYEVDAPAGPRFVCVECNAEPSYWRLREDVFYGPLVRHA